MISLILKFLKIPPPVPPGGRTPLGQLTPTVQPLGQSTPIVQVVGQRGVPGVQPPEGVHSESIPGRHIGGGGDEVQPLPSGLH